MKLFAKLALAPLAVLALTGAVYHGNRVTIDLPEGWTAPEADKDGIISSRPPGGGGPNCNIQFNSPPDLAKMTVAEINSSFGHAFDLAEWADFIGRKTDDITVIESSLKTVDGDLFHVATLRIKASADVTVMVRYGFFMAPERVTMAGCYVGADSYDTYSAAFDHTISSLRPR
ncbi:MAG TPA: hypothetical protein VGO52_03005 [Hyphomonadaceae bacterium]|jgi:hypothetical protein|nr:hypothetical protein [Hyphomonadaceae bacterium]